MAIRLLQKGFRVAVATKPLSAGGRTWPRGTFVVRVTRNLETVHDEVARLAEELGVHAVAINTGFNDDGDTGVGGENVYSLRAPKVAVLADEPVDQTSFGSMWWTFDRYGVRMTPLSISGVKAGALNDFNVLIIPDGSPSRLFSAFGAGGVTTLKDWVSGGSTLVTTRGSSVFAALKDVGLTTAVLVGSAADEQKGKSDEQQEHASGDSKPSASPTPTGQDKRRDLEQPKQQDANAMSDKADVAPTLPPIASPSANANKVPEAIPGSIMRATVDRTTYLTYGLEQDHLPVMLASGYFYRYSKEGTNALVFDSKPALPLTISGFVWEGNTEKLLSGTAYVIDESNGSGHVILFAEDPIFRGIFRSTTRPFLNSILLSGVF
jgi:hypothetical protein